MQTSVIGYPRIGAQRELKFWVESYFQDKLDAEALLANAAQLRARRWDTQRQSGIDLIPSGDFSLYDGMLDLAALLGIVPQRYRALGLSPLDTYFAMAKGYQGPAGDVKALPMKKWFNTNYHYIVPEIGPEEPLQVVGTQLGDQFREALAQGILTKPVLPGPLTLLKLSNLQGRTPADCAPVLAASYRQILQRLGSLGADWVQIDEPVLVTDLSPEDIALLEQLYGALLEGPRTCRVLLQTYFGDIRDCYPAVMALPLEGVGLDFVEGRQTAALVARYGIPADKTLFAGLVNGKNIWRNNYAQTLATLRSLPLDPERLVLSTSCSLLHVPHTLQSERRLAEPVRRACAFAEEKLGELVELAALAAGDTSEGSAAALAANRALHQELRGSVDEAVRRRVAALQPADYDRAPRRARRAPLQQAALQLPLLPTTTIGSFPQTPQVRQNRNRFRRGEISQQDYEARLRQFIADCVALQEEVGLDVLVHGEFERNDMVEYFGENLAGFVFTQQGWVQSYGTRCVKPPIIFGDVSRRRPITVEWSRYAQGLTSRPMKAMLTGPITIVNWSFPREDLTPAEQATQIALAIRDEVLDLEAAGLRIIQIDEAALREKLPLRQSDWHSQYLDWAIPTFRLTHSGVRPETQIHTHMCYSEFEDILPEIDAMDADVISFEASRSSLEILRAIRETGFETAVGPGVYDIHSPRIPSHEEIEGAIRAILQAIPAERAWINPDCGLKTRGPAETEPSLRHMVAAATAVRGTL
ncbi:MAG: 5-methyltetrahydropteroyltriglutamate--homocysteine S-methyltransferase [Anaerolineae bacterium]|jgi:5-methyltetrahydropteroyltriglutamate--homocysteine methyltransferase|nr:5-methyltetrahydropteroyltriglutamate--homocysteine S-methyltransferase [Chloroflexota bacterium]